MATSAGFRQLEAPLERMLELFGLGADEEDLYLWLLEHPWEDPSLTAEPVLDELRCRGLAIQEQDGRWSAMPPDIAVEMLSRAREFELHAARRVAGPLMDLYRVRPAVHDDCVELVEGPEAIAARVEKIVASARWELCGFDKPPYIAKDMSRELAALRRGVAVRAIYERDALTGRLADIGRLTAAGELAKVLPSVPFKLIMADQRWGLVPVHRGQENSRALLVRSSPMLDALQALFDAYWCRALPLRCTEETAEPEPADQVDRVLLTLLAAGVTDQAIARHLGLGLRTVQRRVSSLMRQLGAQTRFQAGLQAARRGLL